jgi:hypothetical protein
MGWLYSDLDVEYVANLKVGESYCRKRSHLTWSVKRIV